MAKAVFLEGFLTYDGNTIHLTNLEFTEEVDTQDVTDLTDTLFSSSFESDKKKRSFTAEGWKDLSVGNVSTGVVASAVLDFAGYQMTGSAIINTIHINAVFDAAIRYSITGIFTGAVVEDVV